MRLTRMTSSPGSCVAGESPTVDRSTAATSLTRDSALLAADLRRPDLSSVFFAGFRPVAFFGLVFFAFSRGATGATSEASSAAPGAPFVRPRAFGFVANFSGVARETRRVSAAMRRHLLRTRASRNGFANTKSQAIVQTGAPELLRLADLPALHAIADEVTNPATPCGPESR
jgi:hypothetical protein